VNSFGFGGTNAHAIVRSDNAKGDVVYFHNNMPPPPLLLTAHSSEALPALAAAYTAQWPAEPRSVPAFVGSAAHLRDHLPHRLLIRGGSNDELRHHVQQYVNGEKPASMLAGYALGNNLPVAFLFQATALNGWEWEKRPGKHAPFREASGKSIRFSPEFKAGRSSTNCSARPCRKNSPRDLFSAFAIGAAGSNRKSS